MVDGSLLDIDIEVVVELAMDLIGLGVTRLDEGRQILFGEAEPFENLHLEAV